VTITDEPITVRCRPRELATCMQMRGWDLAERRNVWLTVENTEKVTRHRADSGRAHVSYLVMLNNGETRRFAPNASIEVTAHSYYQSLNMLGDTVMDWPLETGNCYDDGATACMGKLRYWTPGVSDVTTPCRHTFYFSSPRELLQQIAQHAHDIKHEGAR